jgi:adenylylsulfate kinase-like enzyme
MTENIVWHHQKVTRADRATPKNQSPYLLWFTGLSGFGKSTIANALDVTLYQRGCDTFLLDRQLIFATPQTTGD